LDLLIDFEVDDTTHSLYFVIGNSNYKKMGHPLKTCITHK